MPERRILVVDDDRDLRITVAQLLEDEGYGVLQAENGRQALELLRSAPLPDLVLLDMMMPVMNGHEFRAAQVEDPAIAGVPVALMTAGRLDACPLASPPCAVLRKPVPVDLLLGTVATILAERGT